MYFLLIMVIFHCYVSLPEGISDPSTISKGWNLFSWSFFSWMPRGYLGKHLRGTDPELKKDWEGNEGMSEWFTNIIHQKLNGTLQTDP